LADSQVRRYGVANADGYHQVAAILRDGKDEKKAIVVSAMDGATDALLELVGLAQTGKEAYLSCADALNARHVEAIETLLPPEKRQHHLLLYRFFE